jgi:pseudomonalisin
LEFERRRRRPYQQGITGVVASGRNQPDISLAADPNNGTSLYFNGNWLAIGGTSWASPIFTAYLTEVAQMHGTRAGFVNPSLYNAYTQTGYSLYHDITSGNNLGYWARAGFDQASGIGSISSGYGLASALP